MTTAGTANPSGCRPFVGGLDVVTTAGAANPSGCCPFGTARAATSPIVVLICSWYCLLFGFVVRWYSSYCSWSCCPAGCI